MISDQNDVFLKLILFLKCIDLNENVVVKRTPSEDR